MKKIFVSDFDGTLSLKDFYWILIDDYIGAEGKNYYLEWKKNNKIDVAFLNKIFTWHTFSQEEHHEILNKVEIDQGLFSLLPLLDEDKVDFSILSAGFRYYIDAVLKRYDLQGIEVITNEGVFEKGVFRIIPNTDAWYYSEVYGVNKESVIKRYKKDYDIVFFAGDSEPDYLAALAADVRFAKAELAHLLLQHQIEFYPYETFEDIVKVMKTL